MAADLFVIVFMIFSSSCGQPACCAAPEDLSPQKTPVDKFRSQFRRELRQHNCKIGMCVRKERISH
jgi:hypothetical protein